MSAEKPPFLQSRYALAGAVAGAVGFGTFLIIHHFLIMPIWFIAGFGIVVAIPTGLLVGWAFEAMQARLPRNPYLAIMIFSTLLTLVLAASFVVSSWQRPLTDLLFGGNRVLPGFEAELASRFAIDLFLVSALSGAALGWLLGRSKQAVGRMTVAALAFAAGPGHNVPVFPNTSGAATMWILTLGTILAAALSFGTVLWLADRKKS